MVNEDVYTLFVNVAHVSPDYKDQIVLHYCSSPGFRQSSERVD